MFARCGPATAASAGPAGMTSRLPVIPPLAFRSRQYSSSALPTRSGIDLTDQSQQSSGRLAMDEAQLAQQLDLHAPTDVLRRLFIGPHSKIRSRDINHRVSAMQRRADQTQLERQRADEDSGSGWMWKRLRPPPRSLIDDPSVDERNALLTTMDLLRSQLKACNTPEDLLHVVAATSKSSHPNALKYLGSNGMQRIMYNKIKSIDAGANEHWQGYELERTIGFINTLHARLKAVDVPLIMPWFALALQYATAALNTDAIRHWLISFTQLMQASGVSCIPQDQVSVIIQDLLSAVRVYKEHKGEDKYIWPRTAQALMAILINLPSTNVQDCSLHSHVSWDNPSQVSAFVTLFSYLNPIASPEEVYRIYEKATPSVREHVKPATIHALLRLGDAHGAWNLLATMDKVSAKIGAKLWPRLFEAIADIPTGLLDRPENTGLKAATEQAFGDILTRKLAELEETMGVRWVAATEPGEGHHVLQRGVRLKGSILEHHWVPVPDEEMSLEEAARAADAMLNSDDSWVDV